MKNSNAVKLSSSAKNPGIQFLKNGAFAALLSLAFLTVFLSGIAMVVSKVSIPFSVHQTATSIAAAIAALLGAFIVAKKRKSSGFLLGLLTGGIVFATLVVMVFIFGDRAFSTQTAIKFLILLCAGAIGGLWGVSRANAMKKVKVKI